MTDNSLNNADGEVRREPRSLSFHPPKSDQSFLQSDSPTTIDEVWVEAAGEDPIAAYDKLTEAKLKKTASDPLVGKVLFGTYQVLEVLGEGSMGLVYKAKHLAFERLVAMKTLKTMDPEIVMRFRHEVKLLGSLKHQNIVEAIDCFEAPTKQTFFVMEFIEGISLDDLIRSEHSITREEHVYRILSQVCDALAYAHAASVVHRDLKPGNIMLVERDGMPVVKVVDFGMAKVHDQKITKTGQAVGSPLYMSAEQCMGYEDIDGRADLYSLGIVAYEMLTGELPFLGRSFVETMEKHCNPNVLPKTLLEHGLKLKAVELLDSILARALQSERDKRYQNAGDLKRALEFWYRAATTGGVLPEQRPVGEEPVPAARSSESAQLGKEVKRSKPQGETPKPSRKNAIYNRGQEEFSVHKKTKIPAIAWIVGSLMVLVLCMFGMLLGIFVWKLLPTQDAFPAPPIQSAPQPVPSGAVSTPPPTAVPSDPKVPKPTSGSTGSIDSVRTERAKPPAPQGKEQPTRIRKAERKLAVPKRPVDHRPKAAPASSGNSLGSMRDRLLQLKD